MRLPREREISTQDIYGKVIQYDIDINKLILGYDKAYDYDIKLTANNKPEYADKESFPQEYTFYIELYLKVAREFLLIMNVGGLIGEGKDNFLRIWTIKGSIFQIYRRLCCIMPYQKMHLLMLVWI